MKKESYKPSPLDTSDVSLPENLLPLTESMANNVHEVWASGRIQEGWSYGSTRNDDKKTHPCLVPYDELPESEREYDRQTAIQTLKLILKLGFEIKKRPVSKDYTPLQIKWKRNVIALICLFISVIVGITVNLCVHLYPAEILYTTKLSMLLLTLFSIAVCSALFLCIKELIAIYARTLESEKRMMTELYLEKEKRLIILECKKREEELKSKSNRKAE